MPDEVTFQEAVSQALSAYMQANETADRTVAGFAEFLLAPVEPQEG
jgi:hypothetical protein